MDSIFILIELDDERGGDRVICWSANKAELEAIANEKEWTHYQLKKQQHESRKHEALWSSFTVRSPDETSYRRFEVEEIPRA